MQRVAEVWIVVAACLGPAAWWYIDKSAEGPSQIGGLTLQMTIVVVEAETNRPIANALVRIHNHYDALELARGHSEGHTDAEGTVDLAPELIWASEGKWHRRSGWIRFWDKAVSVTSAGYEPLCDEMEAFTGRARPLHDLSPVSIVVKMKPNAK